MNLDIIILFAVKLVKKYLRPRTKDGSVGLCYFDQKIMFDTNAINYLRFYAGR